ncbi:hypothetical protein HYV82_03820 [Candidatus Woesearchaeota archaeon]|nr:hypothetical protein [Candidatus Woesearchaeota archaeon]
MEEKGLVFRSEGALQRWLQKSRHGCEVVRLSEGVVPAWALRNGSHGGAEIGADELDGLESVVSEKLVAIKADCGVISAVAELRFGDKAVLYIAAVPYGLRQIQYELK